MVPNTKVILSFVSDGSRAPLSSSYTHAFTRVRNELDLKHLHFHTLRHAFGTELAAQGIDLVTIAKLLRHRDTVMVGRTYAHGTAAATERASLAIDAAFQLER